MSAASGPSPTRAIFARYLAPQWRSVVGLGGLLVLVAGVQIVHPRLLASFVDGASERRPVEVLTRLAIAFIALAVIGQLAAVADAYLAQHVALTATNALRADLTHHCLQLDLSFHSTHRPGELIQRVEGDVGALANLLSRFAVALAGNVLLIGGVVVVVGAVDWRLGAVLASACVAVPAAGWRHRAYGRRYWEPFLEAQAEQSGLFEEVLTATEDLRSAGATGWAVRRSVEAARTVLGRQQRGSLFGNLVGTLGGFAFQAAGVALLGLVGWLAVRGQASVGDVFLVFTFTQMLGEPVQVLTRQLQDLQTAGAAIARIDELLQTSSAVVDGTAARLPDAPHAPRVELDGVDFAYADDEPVLRDVSFTLEPGRVLGLLGRTGSGKTTVARLLTRFYDPASGVVRVAGEDLRDVPVADVRRHVALVTQDVRLFHASARDNLTLFDPTIGDDRVRAAIDELGLAPWVATLPDGLDSLLTADTGLSAGEAQLLAFARVFLRDPGLVILDEATARLDPATERHVEEAVTRLFEGRTAIVIAHRLQTVLRADDVLVLEDGRILEHGDRAALAADPTSRFRRLLATGLEEVLS